MSPRAPSLRLMQVFQLTLIVWDWALFPLQSMTFGLGVTMLCTGCWCFMADLHGKGVFVSLKWVLAMSAGAPACAQATGTAPTCQPPGKPFPILACLSGVVFKPLLLIFFH